MLVKLVSFIKVIAKKKVNAIKKLKEIPQITKIMSVTGEFNIITEIATQESEDLVVIIEEIENISGIEEIHSLYVIDEWKKSR